MINLCVKLCENPGANLVEISVNIKTTIKTMCKTTNFSQFINTVSHPLFNNFKTQSHPKAFSQFHSTYYHYYNIFKINNIRKV